MTRLTNLFGSKAPTVAAAKSELVRAEADLAAAPTRIEAAQVELTRVADMSDSEHAAAEAELAAAKRSIVRLEAQAKDLRQALAEAETREEAAALRTRAAAARKRMDGLAKALDLYEARSAAVADAAADIGDIETMVAEVNREIDAARRAGLEAPDRIASPDERFRTEPDVVEADKKIVEEKWHIRNESGCWRPVTTLVERDGKMVPLDPSAELRQIETVIPGRTRPGRRLPSPLVDLCLPPARLGGKLQWPRTA